MEIVLEHISKHYRDRHAVKKAVEDVNLRFTSGVWGLLGANGAGKTTLMRMICGIMKPTDGRICYDGVEIGQLGDAYRSIIGYLPQDFGFYPEFTVQQYLEYISAMKGMSDKQAKQKIDELLVRLSLEDVRKKRIVKLSGGMRRRVGIGQALLNDPEFLVLDEPTSGLDPGERVRFRNLLSEFAHDRIVLISTHIVSDVEYIATQNAIMKNGRILQTGTTQELVTQMQGKVFEGFIVPQELEKWEKKVQIVNLRNEADGGVSLRYIGKQEDMPNAVPKEPRLEDLYLQLFPAQKHSTTIE
ncbi:MAG: ABC transporter ATP-binding protein [Lachnospiraceae bacterium]|nr:ABC transporter ATP-binding protein [Lachnospiraceae bacterium]